MIREALTLAFRALGRNVLRSSLTVLGIVIGVGAVIAMVTIGNGTTLQVTRDIAKLGTNLLTLRPGQGFGGPGGARAQAASFTDEDVRAIERQISGLRAVAPATGAAATAIFASHNWNTSIIGTTNAYFLAREWNFSAGRGFFDTELHSGKAACVIGQDVRRELFGAGDAIGQRIRLKNVSCEVIGVLAAKGQSNFGTSQDDLVVMPIRAVQRRFLGNRDVQSISISVADGVSTDKVRRDLTYLMRERRHIQASEEDDFNIFDMAEIATMLTSTTTVLTGLLGAVAAVSLLVGGIGIMNIMLVSVTERTREIGIRLAVGAQEHQVLSQFLVEAVVLSLFGGLIGIVFGLSMALAAITLLKVPFVFDATIVAVAFLFSALVGIVFGYVPARRAARLDPIEALRHQ